MNAPFQPSSDVELKLAPATPRTTSAPLTPPPSKIATPYPPTVRIQAKAPSGTPTRAPRSTFLRLMGFVLLMAGLNIGSHTFQSWNELTGTPVPKLVTLEIPNYEPYSTKVLQQLDEVLQQYKDNPSATPAALPELPWWAPIADTYQLSKVLAYCILQEIIYRWPFLLVGICLISIAAICGRGNVFGFLISASLYAAVGLITAGLLSDPLAKWTGFEVTPLAIVLFTSALAYIIHCVGTGVAPKTSAALGLICTCFAGLGILRGWFDHPEWYAKLNASTLGFDQNWNSEIPWGIVLLLTVIGVVSSRGRSIHFLNAVLLAALAYACVQTGMVKTITFAGTDWKPLDVRGIEYVATWRWVMIGELILLSAVLLHLAMGVGSLTLVFAVAWLAIALNVDREIGRGSVMTYAKAVEMTNPLNLSMGRETSATANRGPAGVIPIFGNTSTIEPRPEYSDAQKKALLKKATIRISVIYAWVYLTALFAGAIAAAGLRMLLPAANTRIWATIIIWFAFGASGFWLWSLWPASTTWTGSLTALVVPRTHVYAIVVASLGMLAVCSAWSLRADSRFTTWLYSATTLTFLGTALTLIGIALLIKLTGHTPLPVWAYGAIAAGQSSLMWVLLIHQSDRHRKGLTDA